MSLYTRSCLCSPSVDALLLVVILVALTGVGLCGRCWATSSVCTRCRGRPTVVCWLVAVRTPLSKCGTLLLAACSMIFLDTPMRSVSSVSASSDKFDEFVCSFGQWFMFRRGDFLLHSTMLVQSMLWPSICPTITS